MPRRATRRAARRRVRTAGRPAARALPLPGGAAAGRPLARDADPDLRARPETRELLSTAAGHTLPLYDSVAAARTHLHDDRRTVPSISEVLLPVAGSTRHGRDVVTEACARWDLPDLVAPASIIVTELIANVVDHVGSMMTLRLSLRRRYLNMAVRDGSPQPPVPALGMSPQAAGGRGLLLVNELTYSWGYLPSTGGKVVWAALRRT
ncbi:ATP-binding protein [Actinoplanes sp. CA-252034]|uniref:ATP-binding protein n=1 Tax=Actinoplanes sp. CA-252034 TaxID=3239906 RepID=UPI003D957A44